MKLKKKLGHTEFRDLSSVAELDLAKYCQRIGYQVFNTIQKSQGSSRTLSILKDEVDQIFNELISRATGRE